MRSAWQVRLADAARRDYVDILRWTAERFGQIQARTYDETLRRALKTLALGPDTAGCRQRKDIGPGILSLHVARDGRKGRHLVLFRADATARAIDVLRLLHDGMDLARHIGATDRKL